MPTSVPDQAIAVRWENGDNAFRMTVEAPEGTAGTVAVPTLGQTRAIYMDGVLVWDGTGPAGGVTASEQTATSASPPSPAPIPGLGPGRP